MKTLFLSICLFVGFYGTAQEYKYAHLHLVSESKNNIFASLDSAEYTPEQMKMKVIDCCIKEGNDNKPFKSAIEAINLYCFIWLGIY